MNIPNSVLNKIKRNLQSHPTYEDLLEIDEKEAGKAK